ncbi:hypothetical protein RchiOBHm_Chr4g0391371 [Rosa chinensis]|uniref:Uncharacterized protein n=1 Tax=Rosa chinensis TaxID=74649 RepID=A0A2P6QQF5_ROSCH|nr:hypothetical protein RchiOBHm_Chr4g0391371 [Rosa chinensis]
MVSFFVFWVRVGESISALKHSCSCFFFSAYNWYLAWYLSTPKAFSKCFQKWSDSLCIFWCLNLYLFLFVFSGNFKWLGLTLSVSLLSSLFSLMSDEVR